MAHIWVLELFDDGKWFPTVETRLTKEEAVRRKRALDREGDGIKWGISKYERKQGVK